MSSQAEPMDVDDIHVFDNKENSFRHNNLPQSTEKGYEELDVSDLNMKLRYSFTPASSPMSKSYTANCLDNRSLALDDLNNTIVNDSRHMSQSLHSNLTKDDTLVNTNKLPLQALPDDSTDGLRNTVLQPLDSTFINDAGLSITLTNIDDNVSVPSTSSSPLCTPEAITPVKEVPKTTGSPIMRGLKSVLNMFRPSQSPIPLHDDEPSSSKLECESPVPLAVEQIDSVCISTPISSHKKEIDVNLSKQVSPMRDSIVFNEDLERELEWKDETTIIFSKEKIPIHKLFFQQSKPSSSFDNTSNTIISENTNKNLNCTIEPMDISYNDSISKDTTITMANIKASTDGSIMNTDEIEKDESVFLDCETTFNGEHAYNDNSGSINDTTKQLLADISSIISNNSGKENLDDSCIQKLNNDQNETKLLGESKVNETVTLNICEDKSEDKSHIDIEVDILNGNQRKHDSRNNTVILNETLDKSNENIVQQKSVTDDQKEIIKDVIKESSIILNSTNTNLLKDFHSTEDNIVAKINIDTKSNFNNEVRDKEETQLLTEVCTSENTDITQVLSCNETLDKASINIVNANISVSNVSSNSVKKETAIEVECSEINVELYDKSTLIIESNEDTISNLNDQAELEEEIPVHMISDILNMLENFDTENKTLDPSIFSNNTLNITNDEKLDLLDELIDVKVLSECKENQLLEVEQNKDSENAAHKSDNNVTYDNPADIDNNVNPDVTEYNVDTEELPFMKKDGKNEIIVINSAHNADIDISDKNHSSTEKSVLNTELNENDNIDGLNNDAISNEEEIKINSEKSTLYNDVNEFVNEIVNNAESLALTKENADKVQSDQVVKNSMHTEKNTTLTFNEIEIPTEVSFGKPTILLSEYKTELNEVIQPVDNSKSIYRETNKIENIVFTPIECTTVKDMHTNEDKDITTCEHKDINLDGAVNNSPDEIIKSSNVANIELNKVAIQCPEEELTLSESTSPFVSINAPPDELSTHEDKNNFEEMKNLFITNSNGRASPPIKSRLSGNYNEINFDEIENPFSTKTKMRMSPTKMDKCFEPIDEMKSTMSTEPVRTMPQTPVNIQLKPPDIAVKISECSISIDNQIEKGASKISALNKSQTVLHKKDTTEIISNNDYMSMGDTLENNKINVDSKNIVMTAKDSEEPNLNKSVEITNSIKEDKAASSSELSYFSTESLLSKNSENKHEYSFSEIVDSNTNPFATKSKIRKSPPPIKKKDILCTQTETPTTQAKKEAEQKDQETSIDAKVVSKELSPESITSHTETDKNKTVNTDEEDTVEGPFIEEHITDTNELSNFETNKDLVQLIDLPPQEPEDGEVFIDADAFDFFMNQNKSTEVTDSGKESLFLKFDPLFAKRVNSDGVVEALSKLQKRQSTPKKMRAQENLISIQKSPIAEPSNSSDVEPNMFEESTEDLNVTVSHKPTMIVPPAVNPVPSPRKSAMTPVRSNRLSMTFTSPAMSVIERLLSLSSNNSPANPEDIATQTVPEPSESDRALTQLREMVAEKELNVHHLRCESKELRDRLEVLESSMSSLQNEADKRLQNINELNVKLNETNKVNKTMSVVVQEYERTIAGLIANIEEDKKRNAEEKMQLIKERDEQTSHLLSMEVSFSDLHSKYEKSKQLILSYKSKEDLCKKSLDEYEENLLKMQKNYETLKQHATANLNQSNQELEKINKSHASEVLKLKAMIKRKDLHISSLEETLAQKTKANEELTAICDELINKVG